MHRYPAHQKIINKGTTTDEKKWKKPANLYKYQDTAAPYPLAPSLKNVRLPNPTDHIPEKFPTIHLEDNEEDSFEKTN